MPGLSIDTSRLKELPFKFGAAARNAAKWTGRNQILKDLFDHLLERQMRKEEEKRREKEIAENRDFQLQQQYEERDWQRKKKEIEANAALAEHRQQIQAIQGQWGQQLSQAEQLIQQADALYEQGQYIKAASMKDRAATLLGPIRKDDLELVSNWDPKELKSEARDIRKYALDADAAQNRQKAEEYKQNKDAMAQEREQLRQAQLGLAISNYAYVLESEGRDAADNLLGEMAMDQTRNWIVSDPNFKGAIEQLTATEKPDQLKAPGEEEIAKAVSRYETLLMDMPKETTTEKVLGIPGTDWLNPDTEMPTNFKGMLPGFMQASPDSATVAIEAIGALERGEFENTPEGHKAAFKAARENYELLTGKAIPDRALDPEEKGIILDRTIEGLQAAGKTAADIQANRAWYESRFYDLGLTFEDVLQALNQSLGPEQVPFMPQ